MIQQESWRDRTSGSGSSLHHIQKSSVKCQAFKSNQLSDIENALKLQHLKVHNNGYNSMYMRVYYLP